MHLHRRVDMVEVILSCGVTLPWYTGYLLRIDSSSLSRDASARSDGYRCRLFWECLTGALKPRREWLRLL